jgi:hypothetical protein
MESNVSDADDGHVELLVAFMNELHADARR